MKIVSNFVDYYDSVGYSYRTYGGQDSECVFVRKSSSITLPAAKNVSYHDNFYWQNRMEFYLSQPRVSPFSLFFCGKFYPIFRTRGELLYFHNSIKTLEVMGKFDQVTFNYDFLKKYTESFQGFILHMLGFNHPHEFHLKLNSPYFLVENESMTHKREICIEINPNLRHLGFPKVLDPFTAYQEIEMFFNSVLININDKEVPQITDDKIICEAKGFDKKMSFRKRKKE
jgi:hypothetical protein